MTDREKRIARKRSRASSAKHYNRRKYLEESSLSTNQSIAQQSDTNIQATKSISSTAKISDTNNQTSQLIDEITPVVDSANDFQILAPTRDNTLKKAAGAKKVAVHRSRTVRKLQRQQKLNTSLKRALWRTQKELQRAKKSKELSPRSKIKKFVRGKKISSEVRKKLVFGEVLQSEVKQSLGARSSKVKQAAYKIFSGSMIKHYKLQKQSGLSSYLLRRYGRNKCNKPLQYERAPKSHKVSSMKKVQDFFMSDEASIECADRKAFKIKFVSGSKKIKKRKRYLKGSLRDLYVSYSEKESKPISYSKFCEFKPFNVVKKDLKERDTCLCTLCENMELLLTALNEAGVLEVNSNLSLIRSLCCAPRKDECYLRVCDKCCDKKNSV